jgi:hypothetical protein
MCNQNKPIASENVTTRGRLEIHLELKESAEPKLFAFRFSLPRALTFYISFEEMLFLNNKS